MNRVFSFLLWPKREAREPWKQGRKKRGSITCRTDRANEANKMFIIWLCWLFRFWNGDRELEVRTVTYGPGIDQSQHAKSFSHIIKYLTEVGRTRALERMGGETSHCTSETCDARNPPKILRRKCQTAVSLASVRLVHGWISGWTWWLFRRSWNWTWRRVSLLRRVVWDFLGSRKSCSSLVQAVAIAHLDLQVIKYLFVYKIS